MAKSTKPTVNINGALGLIGKSKNILAPLFEAITNSLESLQQRQNFNEHDRPLINVNMYFVGLTDEVKEIERIEIIDNGIGFNVENYERYCDFFNKSKGYDNRGSGRLQFVHRFSRVEICSFYFEGSIPKYRNIVTRNDDFISSHDNLTIEDAAGKYETKISLEQFNSTSDEKAYFDALTVEDLQREILNHFLLRFYLDSEQEASFSPDILIKYYKNGEEVDARNITFNEIPKPIKVGKISIPYYRLNFNTKSNIEWVKAPEKSEEIKWAHFRLASADLSFNSIQLCSKNIPVQSLRLRGIKKNDVIEGSRYLTAFYGGVLNKSENVSDTVDSFKFPEKKNVERHANDLFIEKDTDYLLMDEIELGAENALPEIYDEVLNIKQEQEKDVTQIAKIHGIPIEMALKANVSLSDDEETITKKIYNKQSESLAQSGFKVKKLFESLKSLNPLDAKYQIELRAKSIELSELIDEQDKEELSRYIIRREMVVEALRMILNEELDHQKASQLNETRIEREGIIHDLIFKRRNKSGETLNDLWVLNEDFVHFDACSDLELSKITDSNGVKLFREIPTEIVKELGLRLDKRPDIFLFWEDGKCILVELKQPKTDLSDHLGQLEKYCRLIANYSTSKIDKFFCYLIGENINPLVDLNEYEETANGDWTRPDIKIRSIDKERIPIALAQIEVVKLSAIHKRAHMRNKSFAEKLGLPELLSPISGD